MSKGERRVRITVTLSPRVVKLVDEQAKLRPDRSRSATIEAILDRADLERRVKAYYAAEPEQADDDAFWAEARQRSASFLARDAKALRRKTKA